MAAAERALATPPAQLVDQHLSVPLAGQHHSQVVPSPVPCHLCHWLDKSNAGWLPDQVLHVPLPFPSHTLLWQIRSRRPLWRSSSETSSQRAGCKVDSSGGVKASSSWSVLPTNSRSPRAGFSSNTASSLQTRTRHSPPQHSPLSCGPPSPNPRALSSHGCSYQAYGRIGVPGDAPDHTSNTHSLHTAGSGHLPKPQCAIVRTWIEQGRLSAPEPPTQVPISQLRTAPTSGPPEASHWPPGETLRQRTRSLCPL